jgi:hypothetical protein
VASTAFSCKKFSSLEVKGKEFRIISVCAQFSAYSFYCRALDSVILLSLLQRQFLTRKSSRGHQAKRRKEGKP